MGIMSKVNYANQPDEFYAARRMSQAAMCSKAVNAVFAGINGTQTKAELAVLEEDFKDKTALAMAGASRVKLNASVDSQDLGMNLRIVCQYSKASDLFRATLQSGNGKVLAVSDPVPGPKILAAKRQLMKRVKVAGA